MPRSISYHPKEAEVVGVREVLNWLKGMGLNGVKVEMDARSIGQLCHTF